ncbi:MAG: transposase zinc-binding domain-containing protein [Eubacteriales bacterium]|nr:transposase zinc-binding domain-containing protein [Eubacteriales bacterium]
MQSQICCVDKKIHCSDPSFGGAMYACPHCGNMKFVPFRCKSRFCPTCSVKYSQERSVSMAFKLIRCNNRHCVFSLFAMPAFVQAFFIRSSTEVELSY